MSNINLHRDLFAELESGGYFQFGSHIPGKLVREILGIEMPEVAPKKVFDQIALTELGAIDYVRNILLGRGKYITSEGEDYRILLASENKRQIDLYIKSADRKLRRALKLSKACPADKAASVDNTRARIVMKQETIRSQFA